MKSYLRNNLIIGLTKKNTSMKTVQSLAILWRKYWAKIIGLYKINIKPHYLIYYDFLCELRNPGR